MNKVSRYHRDIQAFRQELVNLNKAKRVEPENFTNKFLSKRLWQYKKIRIGRAAEKDKLQTLASIYMNIYNFAKEVQDTLEELSGDLQAELLNNKRYNDTEVIYIPTCEMKIVIDPSGAKLEPMDDVLDWKLALEQEQAK